MVGFLLCRFHPPQTSPLVRALHVEATYALLLSSGSTVFSCAFKMKQRSSSKLAEFTSKLSYRLQHWPEVDYFILVVAVRFTSRYRYDHANCRRVVPKPSGECRANYDWWQGNAWSSSTATLLFSSNRWTLIYKTLCKKARTPRCKFKEELPIGDF